MNRYLKNGKPIVRPEIALGYKVFYRLWFKKHKMKKDTILDALYSDLDLEQETEKRL